MNDFQAALASPLETTAIPLLVRVENFNTRKPPSLEVTLSIDIHNQLVAPSAA